MSQNHSDERSALLGDRSGHARSNSYRGDDASDVQTIKFGDEDSDNPREWSLAWKYNQVFLVFVIGLTLPMTSSILAPGSDDIAKHFGTSSQLVIGGQTGFVCMLGIGPLLWAPLSETFGRRKIFLGNLVVFTILQIPTALAPNIQSLIALRTISGLFASVGVANGGGSISDIFDANERATVLGVYLLGPLLGPTLGPLFGSLLLTSYGWRSLFWFTLAASTTVTVIAYFLLHETCAHVVLQERKKEFEQKDPDTHYKIEGQSNVPLLQKISGNSTRALKILMYQPIVLVMSSYQALIFSTMYTLYTEYSDIWSSAPYGFDRYHVALTYLAPAVGFILAASFIVPLIDKLYKRLAETHNDGKGKPEYRLPLANIGAVLLPISLFWFGWAVEKGITWPAALCAMLLFGASQVSIFNTVQNYYIDSFEENAASALAAGAFLRSTIGGVVPLFVPKLFNAVGYGWGFSAFGFLALILMPAPLLFARYGATLRERFKLDL